ncbi:uncharacterized protein LOC143807548 isoform X2 [Ranitomeya variabilis]|uniref:uncharacterized protein LOC143767533 isoform X2 n=1 Tax=Ranitomeya variabilis TaxID=490064 RepID=UPI004056C4A4
MERVHLLWTKARTIHLQTSRFFQLRQQWILIYQQPGTFFREKTTREGQLETARRRPTRRSKRKYNRTYGNEVTDFMIELYTEAGGSHSFPLSLHSQAHSGLPLYLFYPPLKVWF